MQLIILAGRSTLQPRPPLSALLVLVLPQQPLVSLSLLQVALDGHPQVKPSLLRTDGTPLPPSNSSRNHPLASVVSQPEQDRTCKPSVKPREPGSKAALFHQGMFSLDSISTLLVKELHPDFLFFSLFFPFFYMQQETRQDVSQTGRGRLKDTVCATIRTRTIKKKNVFKMSFALSVLAAIYLSTHSASIHLPFYQG